MHKHFLHALALALPAVLVIAVMMLVWGGEIHSAVFALLKLVVTR